MNRESARQEIKSRWRELYPADKIGKGITCPLCGSGQGIHGTGISENPHKRGHLKCWNCGFSGDILDLIQKDHGVGYNEALEMTANSLGIAIDAYSPQRHPEKPLGSFEKDSVEKSAETIETATEGTNEAEIDYTNYYRECKKHINDAAAKEYLSFRGISADVAERYWIGYDVKTKYLIIPATNSFYIARNTDKSDKRRYKNPTGVPIELFNSKALYNDAGRPVFVVEGAIDALSIIEAGSEAISINSTSNVRKLLKTLKEKRTDNTLIICLDNDEAGKCASDTLISGLRELNISHVQVDISKGYKDANEAWTADKKAFLSRITDIQSKKTSRPDNVTAYIDSLMHSEIENYKLSTERKTGFENLDNKIGGLYSGLYCIAATSSLGKTTFANQMADQIATSGGDVIYFSLEQSRLELVSKSLARLTARNDLSTAVTSLDIRKGCTSEAIIKAVNQYKEAVADRISIIEGNFNCTVSFIDNYVRKYIKKTGCKPVVIIDYLQILQSSESNGKKQTIKELVDSSVTELKRISRALNITIFVISSVNRANYLTPIDFESLKESGGIEYTCDVIWGLQFQCLNDPLFDDPKKAKEKREKIKQEKRSSIRKIELVCLKNRNGIANFSVDFDYYPQNELFVPVYDKSEEAESLPSWVSQIENKGK
ncbi:MAG: toprim domain-containing protein [Lachnospiraceae bacterium]|nr:toprim domain-containing protein [Lachnospiraceae bacterium]